MSRRVLTLPASLRRAMVRQAQAARPREACGFLLGRGRAVRHLAPMRNAARGRTTYRIDSREHIALRRALRDLTPPLEIVGVYHSHPQGAAVPSATDLAQAHYPDWTHVIVGLRPAVSVRAFRIARQRAEELTVRLISSRV